MSRYRLHALSACHRMLTTKSVFHVFFFVVYNLNLVIREFCDLSHSALTFMRHLKRPTILLFHTCL